MHSWEPITNLCAKKVLCHQKCCVIKSAVSSKVLCHRAEEAKNFQCWTTDCLFCNVIGGENFLSRKQPMLMKPEVSAGCHQTLSRRWSLGMRLHRCRNVWCIYVYESRPQQGVQRCTALNATVWSEHVTELISTRKYLQYTPGAYEQQSCIHLKWKLILFFVDRVFIHAAESCQYPLSLSGPWKSLFCQVGALLYASTVFQWSVRT